MTQNSRPKNGTGTSPVLLFVYGTLMKGQKLHHHLAAGERISYRGPGKIRAELYRLHGRSYPGAVRTSRAKEFVHGELYELTDPEETLKVIDKVEGCDEKLFVRKRVDVWHGSHKSRAWAYFYAKPLARAQHIPTGNYLQQSIRAAR
jgi:gamma-glutamylcyclotransferase (GGCT)/AIG2-like uncharacterized protein YtfP